MPAAHLKPAILPCQRERHPTHARAVFAGTEVKAEDEEALAQAQEAMLHDLQQRKNQVTLPCTLRNRID